MLRNILRRSVWMTAAAVLVLLCFGAKAGAAGEKVNIYFSDPQCYVGQEVSVDVTISPALGGVQLQLYFDPAYLQYVSCTGGDSPSVSPIAGGSQLKILDMDMADMSLKNYSYTLHFQALQVGSPQIRINENSVFCDAEGTELDVEHWGSSTVTVNPLPSYSSEAFLTALSFTPGTLRQTFSPTTFSYDLDIPASVTSLAFSLDVSPKASCEYSNYLRDIPVGDTPFTIWVTAEDGRTRNTYTVIIHRPQPATEPPKPTEPTEKPTEPATEPTEPQSAFLSGHSVSLELLPIPIGVKVPSGYEIIDYVTEDGLKAEAIAPVGVEGYNHYIFYGRRADGTEGLYLYDCAEKTLQRYGFVIADNPYVPESPSASEEPSESESEPETETSSEPETGTQEELSSDEGASSAAESREESSEESSAHEGELLEKLSRRVLLGVIAGLLLVCGVLLVAVAVQRRKLDRE